MRNPRLLLLLATFALGLGLVACSDDEDGGPTTPEDTTPPLVVSAAPQAEARQVPVDQPITIAFNEPMDAATADGNVTLTSGGTPTFTWMDDQTLVVDHADWTAGERVTVTVGNGLKDAAGNALESAFTFGFWAESTDVVFLASDPADNAADILLNTQLRLLFSHDMDLTSIANATRVNSLITAKDLLGYTVQGEEGGWITLKFDEALPSDSRIEVTISTAAAATEADGGGNLVEEATFSFTTGGGIDTDPPHLVSAEPASGTNISPTTSFLRLTFDEPIDPQHFAPSQMSGQFWLLFEPTDIEPQWSQDNMVITVPLPTPLPAGLPIVVQFDSYQDPYGNVQTTPFRYEATVSGTPDSMPMVDGEVLVYTRHSTDYDDETGATSERGGPEWQRFEMEAANQFRRARYGDPSFTDSRGWEYFTQTGGSIDFRGFHEFDTDEQQNPIEYDVLFTPVVSYVKLPWKIQSWTGTASATAPDGTLDIDYTIEVLDQEDVDSPIGSNNEVSWMGKQPETQVVWIDAFKWKLSYEISAGGEPQSSGSETNWFAPTVGVVQGESHEDEPNGNWHESEWVLLGVVSPE